MAFVKKRGDSYQIRLCLGHNSDGKRISVNETWKPDRKMSEEKELEAARRYAEKREEELKKGYTVQVNTTFDKYVKEVYLPKAKNELKATTYRRYCGIMSRILESLGYMKIGQIQPPQIRAFLDDLAEDKREDVKYTPKKRAVEEAKFSNKMQLAKKTGISAATILNIAKGYAVTEKSAQKFADGMGIRIERLFDRNEEPLSATTILHHFRVLSAALTSAMYDGAIPDNPCKRVKPPKGGQHNAFFLDDEEANRLIGLVSEKAPHPFDMIVITLLHTGMRRGECCGLKWEDIDFENCTISIRRSVMYLPGKGIYEDTPKNESSVRVIRVGNSFIECLKQYKEWQQNEAANIPNWIDSGRIFTSGIGGIINPCTVTSWFHKFVLDNDLPYISIHGLRHTNATLMIFSGVSLTTTAQRLGHSTPATTSAIYIHAIEAANAKAADYIDNVIPVPKFNKNT